VNLGACLARGYKSDQRRYFDGFKYFNKLSP
jgi:hypothetical protein